LRSGGSGGGGAGLSWLAVAVDHRIQLGVDLRRENRGRVERVVAAGLSTDGELENRLFARTGVKAGVPPTSPNWGVRRRLRFRNFLSVAGTRYAGWRVIVTANNENRCPLGVDGEVADLESAVLAVIA